MHGLGRQDSTPWRPGSARRTDPATVGRDHVAYDREHFYLSFGGPIGNAESWQSGLRFANTATLPPPLTETALETPSLADVFAALQLVWTATPALINQLFGLKWCKLAVINSAGEYKMDARLYEAPSPQMGATSSGTVPAQVTAVLTLWSGQTLGRANRGRMYVPPPSSAISPTTGRWPGGDLTTYLTRWRTAIEAVTGEIATAASGTVHPVIMSTVGSGLTKPVAHVRIGDVPDTQRRRRRSISEVYITQATSA